MPQSLSNTTTNVNVQQPRMLDIKTLQAHHNPLMQRMLTPAIFEQFINRLSPLITFTFTNNNGEETEIPRPKLKNLVNMAKDDPKIINNLMKFFNQETFRTIGKLHNPGQQYKISINKILKGDNPLEGLGDKLASSPKSTNETQQNVPAGTAMAAVTKNVDNSREKIKQLGSSSSENNNGTEIFFDHDWLKNVLMDDLGYSRKV